MLSVGSALLLSTLGTAVYEVVSFRLRARSELTLLADAVAGNIAGSLASDPKAGVATLAALRTDRRVVRATLQDRSGRILASYPPLLKQPATRVTLFSRHVFVSRPVILDGKKIGTIALDADLAGTRSPLARYALVLALVGAGSFLAAFRLSSRMHRRISGPILDLAKTAASITNGQNYSMRFDGTRDDEVGLLIERLNLMLSWIETRGRALEETRRELEQRVMDRTAELESEAQGRRRGDEALRKSNERFVLASAAVDGALYDWEIPEDRIYWTDGLTRVFGYPLDRDLAAPDWWHSRIQSDDRDRVALQMKEDIAAARDFVAEYRFRAADGRYLAVLDRGRVERDDSGRAVRMVGFMENVTPLKNLEEQLRQGQKMEAVGRLAGGIAHDFNNLLTTILGYSHLLLGTLEEDRPERAEVEEIRKAGDRAAALTQQLLAFSRRQVVEPRVMNLNVVLANLERMLRRLIGEHIELETFLDSLLAPVKVDRAQIEQVILNVVVNARDAMATGGRLTIRTENAVLDESYGREHPGVPPGSYSVIEIQDTGCGMDEETRRRIFEPFFTTKPVDRGTGLGMATVYGIVEQSGGQIRVDSEVGRGTTITIHLPQATDREVDPPPPAPAPHAGQETILVVEDESGVRKLVSGVLRTRGYRVTDVGSPEEALATLAELTASGEAIDLLLTDVVMPGMSGRELADRVLRDRPETALLYMSGYTEDRVVLHGVRASEADFLQKPFTPEQLLRKVREVLDGAKEGMPPGTPLPSPV